jgi:multidrug efflux system outer membrane protein
MMLPLTALMLMFAPSAQAAPSAAEEAKVLLEASLDTPATVVQRSRRPWWQGIQDASLHSLVQQGLQHSPQLASAAAQSRLAQANTGQSLADLLPTISLEVQGQQMPTDGLGLSAFSSSMPDYSAAFESLGELMSNLATMTGGEPADLPSFEGDSDPLPDTYGQGSAMIVASLPIDIVGRQTTRYLAARRTADGARSDHAAMQLQTTLQVADRWYDLVAARAQVQIIQRQAQSNEALLTLITARFEGADATALDVLQQRQQLSVSEALLPRAAAQVTAAELGLRTTLGISTEAPLPESTTLPAVGPAPVMRGAAQLRADRPDLEAAIARLDAARYQRTSAVLSLAPTVGLTGSAGRQYLKMDETEHVDTWSIGAVLRVPLFLGGRTHAGIRAATAQRDLAQAQLRAEVLSLTQELRSAAADDSASLQSLDAAGARAKVAQAALDESRSRFIDGLIPYVSVLASLSAHQQAELALLDAQRVRLRARVRLHGALGSPWTPSLSTQDTP